MSELTLLVLRIGFLIVLWAFVFAIVYALRTDLFGHRARKAQPAPAAAAAAAAAATPYPSSPVAATAPVRTAVPSAEAGADTVATTSNARALVITSGSKAGAEFPLGRDEITIGRSSDSAIVIRDDYSSTHHARLMLWNDQWMLQDLDSTNGTFLEGARVSVPTPVKLGASIKVGATTFELRR